jgi:hypothetical protein
MASGRNPLRLGALGALVVVGLVWIYDRSAATPSPMTRFEPPASLVVEREGKSEASASTASLPDRRSLEVEAAEVAERGAKTEVRRLAAGRVFRRDGEHRIPLENVRLYVEARYPGATRLNGVFFKTPLRTISDGQGRFEVPWPAEHTLELARGITAADLGRGLELRLTARKADHNPVSAAFEAGQSDVELTLDAVGSLRVRLAWSDAPPKLKFVCTLELGGQKLERTTEEHAHFADLTPGVALLTVRLRGDPEPIATLAGLVIPAGGRCLDPRLDPLDVSRAVAVYSVRIMNERGEVPRNAKISAGTVVPLETSQGRATPRLDPGWTQVVAHMRSSPEIVFSAYDHEDSEPILLVDGLVVTLRSKPRFIISRANGSFDPSIGIEVEQPPQPVEAERLRLNLRESNTSRWPSAKPGPARARLVRFEFDKQSALFLQTREVGPWVEFVVPPTMEGRVELDFAF